MKVLIVDDHILFREGLSNLLQSQPDFEVVAEAGTIGEAVQFVTGLRPDITLLDISLPDGSGLDGILLIHQACPETTIVMLTVHETENLLLKAISNGAKGYLLKNIPVSKLLASLRGLAKGEAALSRTMMGTVVEELAKRTMAPDPLSVANGEKTNKESIEVLTPREREVFRELAREASNQEIAERLVISENTVKIHVHRILKKLNLFNRREAAELARRIL